MRILFFVVVLAVLIVLVATLFLPRKREPTSKPPVLYNLGVNFDTYDPKTGYAGDFLFDRERSYFNKLITEFGINHPHKTESLVIQYIYHLPKTTPLVALTNGRVVDVRHQTGERESNDYEILVEPTDAANWRYGFDHVTNPKVKVGDIVKTGDILAEAPGGPISNPNSLSSVELTLNERGSSNEEIENHCPFVFLDESIKEQYTQKISQFIKDWELFMNDPSIYDEENWVYPGCHYEQINEAAGLIGKVKL